MNTELKCCGCKKEMPKEHYDVDKHRATWFGIYINNELKDWVCVDCWDKGIRYEGFVDRNK